MLLAGSGCVSQACSEPLFPTTDNLNVGCKHADAPAGSSEVVQHSQAAGLCSQAFDRPVLGIRYKS